jgi:hypothetical protein
MFYKCQKISYYNIMIAQSKTRRVKTPSSKIRDKFEQVTKPVQSELPMPKLVRHELEPIVMEEPSPVKAKKNNAWITHVKSIAGSKGIKFRDALRDPETKATYKK